MTTPKHKLLYFKCYPHIWVKIIKLLSGNELRNCFAVCLEWEEFLLQVLESENSFKQNYFSHCFLNSEPECKYLMCDSKEVCWREQKIFRITSSEQILVFVCEEGLHVYQRLQYLGSVKRQLCPTDKVVISEGSIAICSSRKGKSFIEWFNMELECISGISLKGKIIHFSKLYLVLVNEDCIKFMFWKEEGNLQLLETGPITTHDR